MSYEPTEWKTGDVVTSQKLNKLEQGVADGNFIVTFSRQNDEWSCDRTVAEIKAAAESGQNVIMFNAYDNTYSSTYLIKQFEYDDETLDQVSFFCYIYGPNNIIEMLELLYFSDGFIDTVGYLMGSSGSSIPSL